VPDHELKAAPREVAKPLFEFRGRLGLRLRNFRTQAITNREKPLIGERVPSCVAHGTGLRRATLNLPACGVVLSLPRVHAAKKRQPRKIASTGERRIARSYSGGFPERQGEVPDQRAFCLLRRE
jgi:hypothetical protein